MRIEVLLFHTDIHTSLRQRSVATVEVSRGGPCAAVVQALQAESSRYSCVPPVITSHKRERRMTVG